MFNGENVNKQINKQKNVRMAHADIKVKYLTCATKIQMKIMKRIICIWLMVEMKYKNHGFISLEKTKWKSLLTNMLVIGMAVRNFTVSCIRLSWQRNFFKYRSMCSWWSSNVISKSCKYRSHWRFNVIALIALKFSICCGVESYVNRAVSGSMIESRRLVISFNDAVSWNFVVL